MIDGTLKLHNKATGEWEATNKSIAVPDLDNIISQHLSNYYNITQIDSKLEPLATKVYVDNAVANISSGGTIDMTDYYNKTYIDNTIGNINTQIENINNAIEAYSSFNVSDYYTKTNLHTVGNLLVDTEDAASQTTTFTSSYVKNNYTKTNELVATLKHADITQPGTHTTFYTAADADSLFLKSGEVVTLEVLNAAKTELNTRINNVQTNVDENQLVVESSINNLNTEVNNIKNIIGSLNSDAVNDLYQFLNENYYNKDDIKELFHGRTANGDNMKF